MRDEDFDVMGDPLLAALARLPSEDLDAARIERTRRRAHRELKRSVERHQPRLEVQLATFYERVLEPGLVACYGVVALGRAAVVLAALFR